MWANLQKTADLVTFTEEILNGKQTNYLQPFLNTSEITKFEKLRISSKNVGKFAGNCRFGHIY